MKKILVAVLFLAGSAAAQVSVPAGSLPPALPPIAPAAPTSLDLYPLGQPFGAGFQFGIDKSPSASGCIQRELHDGQWLGGPCRDIFILAKNGQDVAHIGAALLYNAEHGNASFEARAGITLGPAVHAALIEVSDKLPGLDALAHIKVPKFLSYIGDAATLDYAAGYRPVHSADVHGNFVHGPMVKLTARFGSSDAQAIVKGGM